MRPIIIGEAYSTSDSMRLIEDNLSLLLPMGFKACGFDFDASWKLDEVIEIMESHIAAIDCQNNNNTNNSNDDFQQTVLNQLPSAKGNLALLKAMATNKQNIKYFGFDMDQTERGREAFRSFDFFSMSNFLLMLDREKFMAGKIAAEVNKYNGGVIAKVGFKHLQGILKELDTNPNMKEFEPIYLFILPSTYSSDSHVESADPKIIHIIIDHKDEFSFGKANMIFMDVVASSQQLSIKIENK